MGTDPEDPDEEDLQYLEDEATECLTEFDNVVVSTGLVSSSLMPPETVDAVLETYAQTMVTASWTPAEEISISTDTTETDIFEGTAFSVATALEGEQRDRDPFDRDDDPELDPSAAIVTAVSRAAQVYRDPEVDIPRMWTAYEQVVHGEPLATVDPDEIEKGEPDFSLTELYEEMTDGAE